MLNRNCEMLLLNEKNESSQHNKKKTKTFFADVAVNMIYGTSESSIHEIVKKRKEICATFSVAPQIGKVRTMVFDSA